MLLINPLFRLNADHYFSEPKATLSKLLPLTNHQSKNQRLFIYYHKSSKEMQQIVTFKKLESISYWHFGLKNDDYSIIKIAGNFRSTNRYCCIAMI